MMCNTTRSTFLYEKYRESKKCKSDDDGGDDEDDDAFHMT